MSCAACAVSVESMLKSVEGVESVSVNFANQAAQVEYDPSVASLSAISFRRFAGVMGTTH